MASVRITHYWPDDGGCTVFEMMPDRSYPDELDQARATVMRMWREAAGVKEIEPTVVEDSSDGQ
jgi:hypothetical protein